MADKNIQYTTREGDRWDTVSFKAYGTPFEVERIIAANPNIPVTDRLSGGLVIECPVMEDFQIKSDKTLLPPWKR